MGNGDGAQFGEPLELSGDVNVGGADASPFHRELQNVDSLIVGQADLPKDMPQTEFEAEFRKEYPTDQDFETEFRSESRKHMGLPEDASSEDLFRAQAKETYDTLKGPNTWSQELIDHTLKELGIPSLEDMTEKEVFKGLIAGHEKYSEYGGPFSYEGLEKAVIDKQIEQMKTGTLPEDPD